VVEPEHRASMVTLLSDYLAWRHTYTEIRSMKHIRCSFAIPEPALNGHFMKHNCGSMRLINV